MAHLFVAHGDLTKLSCDALVIPCDEELNVTKAWKPILPESTRPAPYSDWLRIEGTANSHGVVDLPAAGKRNVYAFVCPFSGYQRPAEPIDGLWTALNDVVGRLGAGHSRSRPLIGIPLVGTGEGGLASERGEVIAALLDRHRSKPFQADLALVLFDRRDFAAVQNQRSPQTDWPDLADRLWRKADELGHLAAKNELSLFLGAGVSRPAGLPDWPELLKFLAFEAGMTVPEGNYESAATRIKRRLGERYEPLMRSKLDVREHAVGHALLAGLRVSQMVTTNFDPCMELALEATHKDQFRVLVRQLAVGGNPWLLKLHGDIRVPGSLVLDSEDIERHRTDGAALSGVVQSLLLTSHLLFVGFSFKDQDFLRLAHAVTTVRQSAKCGTIKPVGTALALTPDDFKGLKYDDLNTITLRSSEPDEAARELEIFLDRLGWAATKNDKLSAEYLLDERYESGLSDEDAFLLDLLVKMAESTNAKTRASSGWSRVESCLMELGADPRWLATPERHKRVRRGRSGG
jgi:hypothetical protein